MVNTVCLAWNNTVVTNFSDLRALWVHAESASGVWKNLKEHLDDGSAFG